jgi:class 3 adenylate cyclase
MLKSRTPQDFEYFITTVCEGLAKIIKDNYGIFDKFTGDGVLAFFPDFYSGEDAGYFAVKSAASCHSFFNEFYHNNRQLFNIISNDTGLGIGLDYGRTHLSRITTYTVIGHPVVYACRFSATNHKTTLANHPCYELLNNKYSGKITFKETIVPCKNEGNVIAYVIEDIDTNHHIQAPDWDSLTKKYLNNDRSAKPSD